MTIWKTRTTQDPNAKNIKKITQTQQLLLRIEGGVNSNAWGSYLL
jgi:hypothetical protein